MRPTGHGRLADNDVAVPTATAHDGSDTYFETHGQGPALMMYVSPRPPKGPLGKLSRGLASTFTDELSDRFRLIFVDYPRPAKPDTLTPSNVTRDLLAVADAAGAERFGWWGYSWGGVIGLQLAASSDRVNLLVCGGFPPLGGPYKEMLEVSRYVAGKTASLPIVKVGLPAKVRDGARQFETYYEGLQDFDDRAVQSRFAFPRLCYVGGADRTKLGKTEFCSIGDIVRDRRAELEDLGWQVEIVPELGHTQAMGPEVFVDIVKPWLHSNVAPVT